MIFLPQKSDSLYYVVRDDSHYSLGKRHVRFVSDFCTMLQKYTSHAVVGVDAKKQVEFATDHIFKKYANCNIISLDKWFRGHFDVLMSRIFKKGQDQSVPCGFIIRNEKFFREHLALFDRNKKHVIVDDDIASGYTMSKICDIVKEYSDVKPVLISMDCLYRPEWQNKVFDIVDIRDFIPNSLNGGLFCVKDDGTYERVPYFYPDVDLVARMKLTKEDAAMFTQDLKDLLKHHNL